jgi:hypothetical protein
MKFIVPVVSAKLPAPVVDTSAVSVMASPKNLLPFGVTLRDVLVDRSGATGRSQSPSLWVLS